MAYDPKLSWAGVGAALSGPGIGPFLSEGYLRIYSGVGEVPVRADDPNGSNVLLAELTLGAEAFVQTGDGVLTANTITADLVADASGAAAYARYYRADGTTSVFQGLCGLFDSDFVLDDLDIIAGDTVGAISATLRMVRE